MKGRSAAVALKQQCPPLSFSSFGGTSNTRVLIPTYVCNEPYEVYHHPFSNLIEHSPQIEKSPMPTKKHISNDKDIKCWYLLLKKALSQEIFEVTSYPYYFPNCCV